MVLVCTLLNRHSQRGTYYEEHEDPKTKKTVREYKTRRVKDQNVQNSINNKRNKIGSNNSEMNRIVDRLRNSI